jgi:hypothetical protein
MTSLQNIDFNCPVIAQLIYVQISIKTMADTFFDLFKAYLPFVAVFVVVAGLIVSIGLIAPRNSSSNMKLTLSKLHFEDFKLDTEGKLTLVIGNRASDAIQITNITAEYPLGEFHFADMDGCTSSELRPTKYCTQTISGLDSLAPYSTIKIPVSVEFTEEGVDHTESGTLTARVEPA